MILFLPFNIIQYNKILLFHATCFKHCSYDHKPKWLGYYHNINYVGWKNLVRINQHYGSCYATYKLAILSSRVCSCSQLATKFLLKWICLSTSMQSINYITYANHDICFFDFDLMVLGHQGGSMHILHYKLLYQ